MSTVSCFYILWPYNRASHGNCHGLSLRAWGPLIVSLQRDYHVSVPALRHLPLASYMLKPEYVPPLCFCGVYAMLSFTINTECGENLKQEKLKQVEAFKHYSFRRDVGPNNKELKKFFCRRSLAVVYSLKLRLRHHGSSAAPQLPLKRAAYQLAQRNMSTTKRL